MIKAIFEEVIQLSPSRRALFESLLMREEGNSAKVLALKEISPRQKVKYPPAAILQQRFWFVEQLIPENPVHYVDSMWSLQGRLDLEVLQQSIDTLSQHHEILRTTFSVINGQLTQVIATTLINPLVILKVSDSEDEIQKTISQTIKQPFNLTIGPLWRITILQLTPEKFIFILSMHHIITDGQSVRIFLKELSNLYLAFSQGETPQLLPLTVQYADFAIWQQNWLTTIHYSEQLSYWQKQLAGFEYHALPTDYPHPSLYNYHGTRQSLVLSKILLIALKEFSEQENATLFMTLLTIFKIFLYQYTQQDLLVCSPIAGRTQPELESLIGCFNNLLLFRTHLDTKFSFREALQHVRQVTLEAYSHADVPLQKLAELSNDINHAIPQLLFALYQPQQHLLTLPKIKANPLNTYNETANFDFFLIFEEKEETFTVILEYRTTLFKKSTISQFLEYLQLLIEVVITQPNQPISELPLLVLQKPTNQSLKKNTIPPHNLIETQLVGIWEKILNIRPIGVHDNFFQLGGHSLLVFTLLNQIEKDFNKRLLPKDIFQCPTIAQLALFLQGNPLTTMRHALELIQTQGKNYPLFFVGSTNYARALAPLLGTEQPVYGLNIFGLQPTDGSRFNLSVEEIAQHYLQEIRTIQPSGPYHFAGYCADARVALEISQQLQQQGEQVALLAFIDVIWQAQPRFNWRCHWQNFLKFGVGYLFYKVHSKLKFKWYSWTLSFSHFREKLYRLRKKKLIPQLKHTLLIDEFYNALDRYVPKPYPGKITLFLSDEWRPRYSPSGRLSKIAQGGIELYEIPGYHSYVFDEPQLSVLAKQLRHCLVQSNSVKKS